MGGLDYLFREAKLAKSFWRPACVHKRSFKDWKKILFFSHHCVNFNHLSHLLSPFLLWASTEGIRRLIYPSAISCHQSMFLYRFLCALYMLGNPIVKSEIGYGQFRSRKYMSLCCFQSKLYKFPSLERTLNKWPKPFFQFFVDIF